MSKTPPFGARPSGNRPEICVGWLSKHAESKAFTVQLQLYPRSHILVSFDGKRLRNFDRFLVSTGLPTRGCWHLQGQKGAFHRQPTRNLAASEISGHFSGRAAARDSASADGKSAVLGPQGPTTPWFGAWRPVKWPEIRLEIVVKNPPKCGLRDVLLLC